MNADGETIHLANVNLLFSGLRATTIFWPLRVYHGEIKNFIPLITRVVISFFHAHVTIACIPSQGFSRRFVFSFDENNFKHTGV